MNKLGLYLHIPFCKQICAYCDFCKRVSSDELKEKYIDYLIKEIELSNINKDDIDTIYIGGGTPSSLALHSLAKLLAYLDSYSFSLKEYTIEINPEDLTKELVDLLVKYHINRVSIGIQTISERLNLIIGRCFNLERFNLAYTYLKEHIVNINLDIMYAIPTQTLDDLKETIEYVLCLKPTHLSIYSLILEEKTILYHLIKQGQLAMISEELEMQMVALIHKLIFPKYNQYEVSNYSLKTDINYEAIHNLKYWHNEEYLGFGLNASSYCHERYQNVDNLKTYFMMLDDNKLPIDSAKIEVLTVRTKKEYALILGLRLVRGIDITNYQECYQSSIFDDFPKINELIKDGYLEISNNCLRINYQYFYVMNTILTKLL